MVYKWLISYYSDNYDKDDDPACVRLIIHMNTHVR